MMCRAIGLRGHFNIYFTMNIVILGISSDIGLALGVHWSLRGHNVFGTYRTFSAELAKEANAFNGLYRCDLLDNESIDQCAHQLQNEIVSWDMVVLCPGTMEPIGRFDACDIDQWNAGVSVNLIAPLRFLHKCLPFRKRDTSSVILFAGGGSNSAPLNVSSYTVAKIALIKATELLDAEFTDIKFSIIGPGWVKTKIHQETLRADCVSLASFEETIRRHDTNDFNSMENVLACCDWLVKAPKSIVGGRNFSSVYDNWNDEALCEKLALDRDMFKLRRSGN